MVRGGSVILVGVDATPDLHAGAPTGSARVVPIHRKRTSVLPSFPLSFLSAKSKQCLLCTQGCGVFLQCSCLTCSDVFAVCHNPSATSVFEPSRFTWIWQRTGVLEDVKCKKTIENLGGRERVPVCVPHKGKAAAL